MRVDSLEPASRRPGVAARTSAVAVAVVLAAALPVGAAAADGQAGRPQVAPAPRVAAPPSAAAPRATVQDRRPIGGAVRAAPRAGKPAATFVVNTLQDSPLATATGTTCRDALAGHACSLRAAVQAANNLNRPVVITLGAHTYSLTDSAVGLISSANAGGTTINGVGEGATRIAVPAGQHYGVLALEPGAQNLGSALFLNDLTLTGGRATYGPGLYLGQASTDVAVLDHVAVTGNRASLQGGGVWVEDASLWANDSTISHNQAVYGGGVYNDWGYVYLSGTSVNANLATSATTPCEGGGLYTLEGAMHVTGGSVSGDVAGSATQPGDGGGAYDDEGALYAAGGVAFDHDTAIDAGYGGGDYEFYGQLSANGADFEGDVAKGSADASGGAIAAQSSGISLSHVLLSHDATSASTLGYGGGAIWYDGYSDPGQLTVAASTVSDDTSSGIVLYSYEGGVTASIDGSTLDGNHSSLAEAAGAVLADTSGYGGVALSMDGDTMRGNTASGGDAAGAVSVHVYMDGGSSLEMRSDTVIGNTSSGAAGTGGVRVEADTNSNVDATVVGSVFQANRAPNGGYGGGLLVTSNGSSVSTALTATGDRFVGNSAGSSGAVGFGGGIAETEYVQGRVTGCVITGNVANGTAANGAEGGGVFDDGYEGATLVGDTITGNRATGKNSSGGGLYAYPHYGGGLVAQSTIDGNAATYGAGIFVSYYVFDLVDSTVARNVAGSKSAAGFGAGVYVDDTAFSATNSTITGNVAMSSHTHPGQGGGVYFDTGGSQTYSFVTIDGNVAAQGAGIYVLVVGGVLRDSIVVDNHATPKGGAEDDCFAKKAAVELTSAGGNVLSRAVCVARLGLGDLVTAAPKVGPLAHNGGPTETMALLARSPAIGAAAEGCTPTDQRGAPRPAAGCDAGAYQHEVAKRR